MDSIILQLIFFFKEKEILITGKFSSVYLFFEEKEYIFGNEEVEDILWTTILLCQCITYHTMRPDSIRRHRKGLNPAIKGGQLMNPKHHASIAFLFINFNLYNLYNVFR
ncbi:MAG: hypothetical protein Edafosvirus6_17 [Edafosvirus sp.]|uniref:Uncharacterized protein n=1 Tax=Edafosvirus sp. TaxID=2487765 RepID=A0A3G4ZTF9_9VIRU|nr:MAG: hypothetical protein Edafosvirus6_17 [Edafosvirus sp.]